MKLPASTGAAHSHSAYRHHEMLVSVSEFTSKVSLGSCRVVIDERGSSSIRRLAGCQLTSHRGNEAVGNAPHSVTQP